MSNNLIRYIKYLRFIKTPQLLYRAMNNHVRLLLNRKKRLQAVDLAITYACHATCPKCFSRKMNDPRRKKLTPDEWNRVSRECLDLGTILFDLIGGEPTVEPELYNILDAIKTKKALISIFTNGYLLNKRTILKLRNHGVSLLKISLDSPYPDEHDRMCGLKGCYARIIAALEELQKTRGIQGHLSVLATSGLLKDKVRLEKFKDIAKKYDVSIGFSVPAPAGSWSDNRSVMLKPSDQEILDELTKTSYITTCCNAGYLTPHCRAGVEKLHITAYGDVIPCGVIQLSFGNVREKKLSEIYESILNFPPFLKPSKVCLCGEDKRFYDQYLEPLNKYDHTPVHVHEVTKPPDSPIDSSSTGHISKV